MKWQILGMNVPVSQVSHKAVNVENGPLRSSSQIAGELECNRRFHSLPHANSSLTTGVVQRRKDFRRDPLKPQSLNLGDTSTDSAVPQAAATGPLLRSASPCKGLSEANSVVVRVSASPEMISLPLSLGVVQNHPSIFCGSPGNVMEGVLPERNHAVKFVAVYDDGTDSHACHPTTNDSCYYQAFSQAWLLHRPILPLHSLRLKVVERLNVQ